MNVWPMVTKLRYSTVARPLHTRGATPASDKSESAMPAKIPSDNIPSPAPHQNSVGN